MTNVTPLRNGRPTLSDLPGMMRHVADLIEDGEVEATSALFIVPVSGDWPQVFGWGEHLGESGNIALCELAKAWFIHESLGHR